MIDTSPDQVILRTVEPIPISTTPVTLIFRPDVTTDLVINAIKEAFGGTYNVTVVSNAIRDGTLIFQTITFTFGPTLIPPPVDTFPQTVTVSLTYFFTNGEWQILSSNGSAATSGNLTDAVVTVGQELRPVDIPVVGLN